MKHRERTLWHGIRRRISVFGAVALFASPNFAVGEISKAYATLHFQYIEAQGKAAEPLEKLDAAYRKKLGELEEEAKKDGDLARVSMIRNELATYLTNRTRATDQRLRAAQSTYERSFSELGKKQNSSLESLARKYIIALEKLKVAETKAGQIASATHIQKEIEEN